MKLQNAPFWAIRKLYAIKQQSSVLIYKQWIKFRIPQTQTLLGKHRKTDVAVIICTWKRLDQIAMTLDCLDKQTMEKNRSISLFIWNNNCRDRHKLTNTISSYRPNGALRNIELYNSFVNIGGFGRFYIARLLHNRFKHVIFIDDDELLPKDFVTKAEKFRKPQTIASHWAFNTKSSYWDRAPVAEGKDANYCGTGGMIVDSSIFMKNELFRCPIKYWFVEDLWLSFFAKNLGWKLTKFQVDISFIEDDKNQYQRIVDKKEKFYQYLNSKEAIR